MWRSRRFRKRKSRLSWWFTLRFVLSGLGRACTLEPARGDRDISHPKDFRHRFQVVNCLLTPIGSWTVQFSGCSGKNGGRRCKLTYVPFALNAKRSILR